MATVVLQTVGAAIGGAVGGPVGAVIGKAAGALGGNFIDQKLFSKDRVVVGPRLDNARILTSTAGTPIPRTYGRTHLSGQIIWATRFEEVVTKKKSSGKGGGGSSTTTKTFSYFANFAVGICEGPISGIRRIWADEQELDLTEIEYRIYTGTNTQSPDPLIEAKQGSGNTPAYRGIAYVVFEDFPLEKYGNRIPQISFEVIRSVGELENKIRSISVIPGATEYGYDTQMVATGGGNQAYNAHNRHTSIAHTDWKASIDELQMVCPILESVSLVVTWYGTDLRAEHCDIIPGVTQSVGAAWSVGDYQRHHAHLISRVKGRSAYGGTPSDASIIRAIADLKARGLKVILYPFIMMDIPKGNVLPWVNGNGQPVYPWRGVISCFPPPGASGSVDKLAAARNQLSGFSAKYSALIMHYAQLCSQAGGVDGFLIGSELRGLTRVRDNTGTFPFVETLVSLANQVRPILGANCQVTYGADWTEYFGYQPNDGSGDVLYNLDPLWASSNIDAIGIDNYMPLSDWKNGGDPSFPDVRSVYDKEYLKYNIARGEGYDWYYTSKENRDQGVRTRITDGQGEPWVFRYKDLVSWWKNPHHERLQGVKQSASTAWIPESKPILITELGCPAIDVGSNQPNVFYDPKSDQSAIPYFSGGTRDDLIQRRFLEAHYEFWESPENNPVSSVYSDRMLNPSEITPWAWDARPFPWFPVNLNIWGDGENWHLGHWLTGRLGSCSLADLIRKIISDHGHDAPIVDVGGTLDGYVIPNVTSAREALEPLLGLFDIHVHEADGRLVFKDFTRIESRQIELTELVQEGEQPAISKRRISELELPAEAIVHHTSVLSGYEARGTKSRRRQGGGSDRQISLQAPIVISEEVALALADHRLQKEWSNRVELQFTLPTKHIDITTGDVIDLESGSNTRWLVESVAAGQANELTLRSFDNSPRKASSGKREAIKPIVYSVLGPPSVALMDLPLMPNEDPSKVFTHLALTAIPWGREYSILTSPEQEGYTPRADVRQRGTFATILNGLRAGFSGRWDYAGKLHVMLQSGSLQSAGPLPVFGGANLLAVKSDNGKYELLQFRKAELQQDGSWILSELLRGQNGTEAEMVSGISAGTTAVIMDDSVIAVEHAPTEWGVEMNWRIGPVGKPISSEAFRQLTFANNARSRRMLSPCHLRSDRRPNGDIRYHWIRRGRIDADSWEHPEILLDAAQEQYQITIKNNTDTLVRQFKTTQAEFIYSAAQIATDLGASPTAFSVQVAQISDNELPGEAAILSETLN